jgi:hypothetical protein
VVTAILDFLKELKKYDVPLTVLIAKRLETLPIAWSPFMEDADLLGHYQEGGYLMLNSKAFLEMNSPRERAALMLHELVHSISGTELDAESIQAGYFLMFTRLLHQMIGFCFESMEENSCIETPKVARFG